MVSYIWRSTTAVSGQGKRENSTEVIEFTPTNISDGKHIRDTTLNWVPGFAENERPKGFNQLQDTGLNSVTYNIIGHIENPKNNDVFQLVKEWLLESKNNPVFIKGMYGIELDNIKAHNVVPASIGNSPEQARGAWLIDWTWMQTGEWPSKGDFEAVFRFNGDIGDNTTSPKYDWTQLR